MLTETEQYRNAVADAKVQAKVLKLSPSLVSRYQQVCYFRQYKGPKCSYFSGALELLLNDLKRLGYKFSGGSISAPTGDKLWPTT